MAAEFKKLGRIAGTVTTVAGLIYFGGQEAAKILARPYATGVDITLKLQEFCKVDPNCIKEVQDITPIALGVLGIAVTTIVWRGIRSNRVNGAGKYY